VEDFFRRVELDSVLPARQRTVRVGDARGDLQAAVGRALGAEDDGDARGAGGGVYCGPRAFEEGGGRRRGSRARPAVAGDEALGEADHKRAALGGFGDGRCCQGDGLLRRCGDAKICQGVVDGGYAVW
jgi:hypothetical protein